MKTKEQVQAAVEEIHQVLVKHGLLMVGTCWSEAIYGQITFFDAEDVTTHDWKDVPGQLNRNLEASGPNFYIYGAGSMDDPNAKITPVVKYPSNRYEAVIYFQDGDGPTFEPSTRKIRCDLHQFVNDKPEATIPLYMPYSKQAEEILRKHFDGRFGQHIPVDMWSCHILDESNRHRWVPTNALKCFRLSFHTPNCSSSSLTTQFYPMNDTEAQD